VPTFPAHSAAVAAAAAAAAAAALGSLVEVCHRNCFLVKGNLNCYHMIDFAQAKAERKRSGFVEVWRRIGILLVEAVAVG